MLTGCDEQLIRAASLDRVDGVVVLAQDGPSAERKFLPVDGQSDTPALGHDESASEFALQSADVSTHRCRRKVQGFGGTAHTAESRHCPEGA